MLIERNAQGWSTSTQGPWQLIFNNQYIIKLFETNVGSSTQEKLFVGTKEECEAKIQELGLPLVISAPLDPIEDTPPMSPYLYVD